ncbi:MAG TPA: hypothetical protein VEI07_00805 [Planctomycetaceae bacterium]|nr:hypothetical protein [Planctomycetaceae bacterium]
MSTMFSTMNYGQFMGLLALGGGLLIGLVAVLGGLLAEIRKTEIAGMLKQDMLARGMSAEEIRTVLKAGMNTSCAGRVESCL